MASTKLITQYEKAAKAAWPIWTAAGEYALIKHGGYSAAIKANKVAHDAYGTLKGYATGYLKTLQADPETDAQLLQDVKNDIELSTSRLATLEEARALVMNDMKAQAMTLQIKAQESPTAQATRVVQAVTAALGKTPEAAAQAIDAAQPAVTAAAPVSAGPSRGLLAGLAVGAAVVIGIIWKMGR